MRSLLACLLGLTIAIGLTPSRALAVRTLRLDPPGLILAPGDSAEVSVIAEGELPPLSCFALTLSYDGSVMELLSSHEGALYAGASAPTFFSQDQDAQGYDLLTDCVLGYGTSVAPPGEIAHLEVRAVSDGVTTLQLLGAVLRDVDRAVIDSVRTLPTLITVGTTDAPPSVPLRHELLAIPNPSSQRVFLKLERSGEAGDGPAKLALDGTGSPDPSEIIIYDLAGRRVRSLPWPSGAAGVSWDGRDESGRSVASGTYFAAARGARRWAMAKVVRVE